MSTISFDDVVAYISQPDIAGRFPSDILRNRLKEMGAKDVLEEGQIRSYGFPLKYHHPLDEAILVLHYFLTRSNSINDSVVHINSIHVPTKEEDNTLSFWKSPKAGLYLDLHSLIENNNRRRLKNTSSERSSGLIQRIFVFRDNAHLAFLESTGIGVILEQQSIGIKTGFILRDKQERDIRDMVDGGIVLIQLLHKNNEPCDWAEWALIMDKTNKTNQPYRNQLVCKWHKGTIHDPEFPEKENINIERYLQLFRNFEGAPAAQKIANGSYYFERDPTGFSELLSRNFDVAFKGVVPEDYFKKLKDNYDNLLDIKATPSTLKQLHAALDRIGESKQIRAIDASSVKSTLKIHESDPNYRHWIRQTVNLAIHDPGVSLERIYILDLGSQAKGDDKIFEQEVNLYRDFLMNKISRLDDVWIPQGTSIENDSSFPAPLTNPDNIKLYVITKQKINAFCENISVAEKTEQLTELLKYFFKNSNGLEITDETIRTLRPEKKTEWLSFYLSHLDFLYSAELLFNYKDYKGEPGQALYDADLFVPGDSSQNKENVITFLEGHDFDAKLEVYTRFFELLKSLSLQVLPIEGDDSSNGDESYVFPPLFELDKKLDDKRLDHFSRLNKEQAQQPTVQQNLQGTAPLEIAHVLFMDIVGYSKLLIDYETNTLRQLQEIVRSTAEFARAQEIDKLIRLPTGDGMALVFFDYPESPVRCAMEISKALKNHPDIKLRMGVHSGPVNKVIDVNEKPNVTGAGINIAQRVMDCGDTGHILVSQYVVDTLEHLSTWAGTFHDLGEVEVKHEERVRIYNAYANDYGNPEIPEKVRNSREPLGDSI